MPELAWMHPVLVFGLPVTTGNREVDAKPGNLIPRMFSFDQSLQLSTDGARDRFGKLEIPIATGRYTELKDFLMGFFADGSEK